VFSGCEVISAFFFFFFIFVLFSCAESIFMCCRKDCLGGFFQKTIAALLVHMDRKSGSPAVLGKTQKICRNFTQGLLLPVPSTHCSGRPLTRRIYVWEGTSWVIGSIFLPSKEIVSQEPFH